MSFVNPRIHVGDAIESAFNWLTDHAGWLFDAIKTVITGLYDAFNTVLSSPPYYVMIAIFAALALLAAGWRQGWKLAIFAVIGFYFIRAFDQWVNAMNTIALVLVSVIIALIIALPIGILAARSRVVSSIVRPVLDLMQTLPGLVYLVPVIIVFGIGPTPGVVSTLIFAMPPGIRLTELAIRQVDPEVVEAGQAFGSSPARILGQIQIPLAMPTIMAGINQVIMLALSMVVIAGFAGAGGLGGQVNEALQTLNLSLGSEAGLAVVIIAVYLDRLSSAIGNRGRVAQL
ncbi:glycine betaine ABC transporter permease protein [Gordonia polyisoprenivorans NBRC 16320 = JCM 10675]|uniref:ABC transporter permease subunit n=1 Tax=Gordonia polyisoprenivorans TaxID=84595 RepID=A0A846WVG4_9ACTN|nr:ABC transporter permease subunit [Gordonia polyisoprenivorans]NKY05037.1 ABC transporter permease subunit [Gordonia polyisoprenivorans]WCB37614.1 ABC transporter permease subunit [Gordonia polyisoprenivorans]GAB22356.1 glycine betaine ABC transporter permease protein [Gordonia polyisoprenivorans NBRC 16320 = JCM 10675]